MKKRILAMLLIVAISIAAIPSISAFDFDYVPHHDVCRTCGWVVCETVFDEGYLDEENSFIIYTCNFCGGIAYVRDLLRDVNSDNYVWLPNNRLVVSNCPGNRMVNLVSEINRIDIHQKLAVNLYMTSLYAVIDSCASSLEIAANAVTAVEQGEISLRSALATWRSLAIEIDTQSFENISQMMLEALKEERCESFEAFSLLLGETAFVINDAIDIIRYVVDLPSNVGECEILFQASLIVSVDEPTVRDSIEIIRYTVGLDSVLNGS